MEDSQKLGDILNAPPEHLRAVLRIFCTKNKEARDTIAEYLSVAREQNLNGLADVEFCMKCEKPYLEANNREGSCCFHDGAFFSDSSTRKVRVVATFNSDSVHKATVS
ncbi:hypothetical protein B0T21DRAFT_374691 [Apiosordaria backusii]|uniref:Uncharacterized protein n=1 Tax=Apiosordaria backusii TaxID=314023 RepID=A0AA40ANF9_9PEZI|nr:hypothetical protein B0T21DRAFT_374691 [Apiosordaria backusii]